MNLSKRSPIAYVSQRPPERRFMGEDGMMKREKISPIPYSRKMVTPSGNVVRIALANGRTIGENPAENSYGTVKLAEKLKQGFLLYAECPYATGRLPVKGKIKPCEGTNPEHPGTFWRRHPEVRHVYIEETCCEHMEDIIANRQAAQSARQAELAESFKTTQDKFIEVMQAEQASRAQQAPPKRPMFDKDA